MIRTFSRRRNSKNTKNYEILRPDLLYRPVPSTVPDHIKKPDYSNVTGISNGPIPIHSKSEIQKIRESCRIAAHVLESACLQTTIGMSTLDIDQLVHLEIIKHNAYPSPLGYKNFPKSVCTSVNNVTCHGIPDNRKLKDGDIINIDVTVYYNGYHGDTSRTIQIGSVVDQARLLIERNQKALDLAIGIIKPNTAFNQIGFVIEEFAQKFGYHVDRHFCGHGIGKLFHQPPLIMHYKNEEDGVMQPGMVFTIEPIFCEADSGFLMWPDGWTVVSKDGSRSAQHEHTVLVTEDGAEVLTRSS